MSEYYKIIEKIEFTSTRRYFVMAHHIVSAASSETGIPGAVKGVEESKSKIKNSIS